MAYAAVISLKQTIKRLVNLSQSRNTLLPDSETELIYQDLSYLESFLQTINSWRSSNTANALQTQIRDAAHKFEDLIESHISDLFLPSVSESPADEALALVLSEALSKIKQELSSLIKTLNSDEDEQPSSTSFTAVDIVSSRVEYPGLKIEMQAVVGRDKELEKLKYWLQPESPSGPGIIASIFGMAGIGKTTLAKMFYYDPVVIEHYDCRLFVPIGPQYELKKLLLLVLDQLGFDIVEMCKMEDKELERHLYECLSCRRYLIVLDDVWSTEVWGRLSFLFPYSTSRSGIILTTRLAEVACTAISFWHSITFLNDDESWKLLHQTVFTGGESCNYQLEIIGRKIAENCEGLPLAIVEVGKLLRGIEKTVENWKKVAEDENPLNITAGDGTPISQTLSLSLEQLPLHLKPCFLYMGMFPKKNDISVTELANLWISEGFIEPQTGRSLGEIARMYLVNLFFSSLVLVWEISSVGVIKSCRLHVVYRLLCVSQARNDKFFHVINKYADTCPKRIINQRRLCVHNKTVLGFKQVQNSMEYVSDARSLVIFGQEDQRPLWLYLPFRLLRVLNTLTICFYEFPHQVTQLIHLRYLAITYDGEIPSSISRLWNLEVLIVQRHYFIQSSSCNASYLPIEIWKLSRLRHLECVGFDLPDPSTNDNDSVTVLENLLTLSGVCAHSCTKGVLARMPYLRKLGIRIARGLSDAIETFDFFGDVAELCRRLNSFKCFVVNPSYLSRSQVIVPNIPPVFPVSIIRKITLSGCGFSWESITYIGRLPSLQVLKLRCYAFQGPVWETNVGEFRMLKFLLMEDLDIEQWRANESQFPWLENLIIRHCYKLREIPHVLGRDVRLEMIEVDDCNPSACREARKEYEEIGRSDIKFLIHSSWEDKKPNFDPCFPQNQRAWESLARN